MRDGGCRVADEVYRVLVLPPMDTRALASAQALLDFCEAGGTLFSLGKPPRLAAAPVNAVALRELMSQLFSDGGPGFIVTLEALPQHVRRIVPPDVALEADNPDLLCTHRIVEGRHVYFLVNTAPVAATACPVLREPGPYTLYRPSTGGVESDVAASPVDLAAYESVFVITNAASERWPDSMKTSAQKARIGIVGTGWWACESHIPGILRHADAVLVAACDRDPERLGAAAEAYGIARTYVDHTAMLEAEDLDGVVVATPHATHFGIAQDCLVRGLNLLIEKPMTLYAADAKRLVDLAAGRNLEIVIGYNYNFLPHSRRAREVIRSGELGEVQYVTASFSSHVHSLLAGHEDPDLAFRTGYAVHGPSKAYNQPELLGGGEGHLQITHVAGLLLFVTGLRAAQVSALMRSHGLAVDLVDALVTGFEGDAIGMIGGTGNAGRNYRMALTIYCEDGCFLADTMARAAVIRRKDGSSEDLSALPRPRNRYVVTDNFIDVILGRAENGSSGELGWHVVELLDAAYRSATKDGAPVKVADLYNGTATVG